MLKPSSLKKVSYTAAVYEFEDPNQDEPWIMWLKTPDDLLKGLAEDLRSKLNAQYVTGGWFDESGKLQKEPELLRDHEDNPIIVSNAVLKIVTLLDVMQDPPENVHSYDAIEILRLIPYYPVAWNQIQEVYYDLLFPAPKAT